MTNEEATTLAEQYFEAYPKPGRHMEYILCLLHDNDALTDEDRDHLAEELEEAEGAEEECMEVEDVDEAEP